MDPSGHVEALCEDREKMMTIGDQEFFPNYGFTIYNCVAEDDLASVSVTKLN